MYPLYRLLHDIFGFTRSQSNGFIILLPLMVSILFSESVTKNLRSGSRPDFRQEAARLEQIVSQWERAVAEAKTHPKTGLLKPFDPNLASEEELVSLGFDPMIARRIINYRNKGGRFRVKADIARVHGIDSAFAERVLPFVALPESYKIKTRPDYKQWPDRRAGNSMVQKRFDLNLADTAVLKRVKGIGEKLSLRIIRYRESLGGFIAATQLFEVYKLDSAVVEQVLKSGYVEEGFRPVRLNINTASAIELDQHPYINRKMAEAIVAYRLHHGQFKSVVDLSGLPVFPPEQLDRLKAYLTVGD